MASSGTVNISLMLDGSQVARALAKADATPDDRARVELTAAEVEFLLYAMDVCHDESRSGNLDHNETKALRENLEEVWGNAHDDGE